MVTKLPVSQSSEHTDRVEISRWQKLWGVDVAKMGADSFTASASRKASTCHADRDMQSEVGCPLAGARCVASDPEGHEFEVLNFAQFTRAIMSCTRYNVCVCKHTMIINKSHVAQLFRDQWCQARLPQPGGVHLSSGDEQERSVVLIVNARSAEVSINVAIRPMN
jgi:hypothetical protein